MIRAFIKTDETMPEHELVLKRTDVTIGELMEEMDLTNESRFVQIRTGHPENGKQYIKIKAIKFLRITEENENE